LGSSQAVVKVALRDATDAEIARVFRMDADHVTATLDGEPVVYVRFQTIEGRRWGMLNVLSVVAPSCVPRLFYALRRRLAEECEPIYALAQNEKSPRLLRLVGLRPTGEFSVGKEIWRWTPGQ
jgi:hypothetical protein